MKKVFILLLVILVFMLKAFSQNMDTLQKDPTCFMIAHAAVKSNTKNVSEIYYVGDKVKVKLKDNQIIQGTIIGLSRDSIIMVDKTEIDIKSIQWISKTKPGTAKVIVGSLLTVGGAAILINLAGGDVTFDETPVHLLLGAGLVTTGIIVLTSRSKFKLENGDQMIVKN